MTYQSALSALNDPTRRSLYERLLNAPSPAGELTLETGVSQSAVSQHLKVLREAGLVQEEREGQRRIYCAVPQALEGLHRYIQGLCSAQADPLPFNHEEVVRPANDIDLAAQEWGNQWPGEDADAYSINHRLLQLGRYIESSLKDIASNRGLQGNELLLLDVLSISPQQTSTPSKLQRRLSISKGGITKLLDRLESICMLTRVDSENDRRVSFVTLSQTAHDLLQEIFVRRDYGPEFSATQRLNQSDKQQLALLLQRLHHLIDEERHLRAGQR
ncbi:metalloregulator ArsR/SmtB family transcription factor [Pseudomonas sp. GB2N2]